MVRIKSRSGFTPRKAVDCFSDSLTVSEIGWLSTAVFLLVGYFTPLGFTMYGFLAWFALIGVITLINILGKRVYVSYKNLFIVGLFCIVVFLLFFLNPYEGKDAFMLSSVALGLFFLVVVMRSRPSRRVSMFFYYTASVLIILTLFLYFLQPVLFIEIGGFKNLKDVTPVFYGAPDKNWTAVFVCLYFALALKEKKKLGIFIGLLYPFVYFGRQYILMIAVMLVIVLLASFRGESTRFAGFLKRLYESPVAIMCLFVLIGVIVGLFSYWWTQIVIPVGVSEYKTSLNDPSNAMRFASIDYTVNLMLADSSFLLRGYGEQLFNMLNISTVDPAASYLINGQIRLVQPHNEVINMLIREGLVFSIMYYGMIALIISKLVSDKYNIAIISSFLLGSMVLHSMFTTQTLMLLVFVLCTVATSNKSRDHSCRVLIPRKLWRRFETR